MAIEGVAYIEGPGWVDHSTNPIMGLFPLAVEQYLNAAVAVNAPGVTTVTNTARYFALHALIADECQRRQLDRAGTQDLLRRVEVVYALICMAHEGQPGHHHWYPAPHGRDRLVSALAPGKVDLSVAAGMGEGKYANATTGFVGPYFGSEVRLGLLGQEWLTPGPAYDRATVHGALGAALELAATATHLDLADLTGFGDLCLCQAAVSEDGELLASRFAGRPDDVGTVAGNLGQVMRLFATAMRNADIRSEADLGDFVMFDPLVVRHEQSSEHWLRWRGIRMRAASVAAWRGLFAHTCRYLNTGPMTIAQLGERLAGELPSGTVGAFTDQLPPVVDGHGEPLPAEVDVAQRPAPEKYLATLALGALRFQALEGSTTAVSLGFVGPPGHRFEAEELSPQWMSNVLEDWRSWPMPDFAAWLVRVMINRAHRVTMSKSYRRRDDRFVMPLRIMVQDDLVVKLHGEATGQPALRWTQLLSMGRQTGIFEVDDDGRWGAGPHGDLLH